MVNTLTPINNTLSKIFDHYNAAQITHALKSNGVSMQDGINNMLSTTYSEGFVDGFANGYVEGLRHGATFGYAEGIVDGTPKTVGTGLATKLTYTGIGIGIGIGLCLGLYLLLSKHSQDKDRKNKNKRSKHTGAQNVISVEGVNIAEEPVVTE